MRYFIAMCVAALTLTACGPNPAASTGANGTNTGTNTGTGGGTATTASVIASKQGYINFLNCIKNQPNVTQDQKTLIDIQMTQVNNIPDSSWAQLSVALNANADVWAKAYGTACGN